MSDTFTMVQQGNGFRPHVLQNTVTGKKVSLCSCGGTHNIDGTCDGTHNKKKELGCHCEYCKEKTTTAVA